MVDQIYIKLYYIFELRRLLQTFGDIVIRKWHSWLTPSRIKSTVTRWAITLVGAGTFVGLLELGVSPLISNLACKLTTTQARFITHRRITWPMSRDGSLWQQWWRYQLLKAAGMGLNQALFWVITPWLPSLVAYFACLMVLKPFNHLAAKHLIFVDE